MLCSEGLCRLAFVSWEGHGRSRTEGVFKLENGAGVGWGAQRQMLEPEASVTIPMREVVKMDEGN